MSNRVQTEVREIAGAVEFSAGGLGRMRSSGEMIVLLMSLESPHERAGILVDAAKELGISADELTETYLDRACSHCGMSLMVHKDNGGRCF